MKHFRFELQIQIANSKFRLQIQVAVSDLRHLWIKREKAYYSKSREKSTHARSLLTIQIKREVYLPFKSNSSADYADDADQNRQSESAI